MTNKVVNQGSLELTSLYTKIAALQEENNALHQKVFHLNERIQELEEELDGWQFGADGNGG